MNQYASRSSWCCRVALALAMLAAMAPNAAAQKKGPTTFNVIPITFTSVVVEDGALVANGLAGTTAFEVPLALVPGAVPAGGTCPVLDLRIGAIHLELLGLNVDTSNICLEITATPGAGLLGDLLCSLAGGLAASTPLSTLLAGLTQDQLTLLTNSLLQVLNNAFAQITQMSPDTLLSATCEILRLQLGPIDLSLLGLNVELDNCAGGPVTVAITATEDGGLLGDLLCDLSNLLNTRNPNSTAILTVLRQIVKVIGGLVA